MQKHSDFVIGPDGRAVAGATIAVTKADGSAATLYSDNGTTVISSTLTSDASGEYSFYAANGRYTKTISKAGYLSEASADFLLFDPTDADLDGTPEYYGAKGDGVTDDTVPIQNWINSGKSLRTKAGRTYLVGLFMGAPINIPSSTSIRGGRNATFRLKNAANNHVFRIDGADNVSIHGIIIDGNKAGNTGGHGIAVAGAGGTKISIKDCLIYDCSAAGVYISGTTIWGVEVEGVYAWGCEDGGITATDSTVKFKFDSNFTWLNGTHGVGILGVAKHGSISHNISWDNGQNVPTADNITGYNAANEDIEVIGNVTFGGLNNGIHVGGHRLRVIGNSAYQAAQYGISVFPNTGTSEDLIYEDNHAYDCGQSGHWIRSITGGSVSSNHARGNTNDGMLLYACTDVGLDNNKLIDNDGCGIRCGSGVWACTRLVIGSANHCIDNGSHGLDMTDVTRSRVHASMIYGNGGGGAGGLGINLAGTEDYNVISENTVYGNVSGQIDTGAANDDIRDNMVA